MLKTENKIEYELSYLLAPEISEEKLGLEVADIGKIIRETGGEVTRSDNPKKRWLSYEVKKQRQAYFGFIYFNILSEGIDKIKSALSFHKKILRFLIVDRSDIGLDNTGKDKNTDVTSEIKSTTNESPNGQSFEKKLESILNG